MRCRQEVVIREKNACIWDYGGIEFIENDVSRVWTWLKWDGGQSLEEKGSKHCKANSLYSEIIRNKDRNNVEENEIEPGPGW